MNPVSEESQRSKDGKRRDDYPAAMGNAPGKECPDYFVSRIASISGLLYFL